MPVAVLFLAAALQLVQAIAPHDMTQSAIAPHDTHVAAQQMDTQGFTMTQLRDAGFSPDQLRESGFSAVQAKEGGYSLDELAGVYAGFDLLEAGFTREDLLLKNISIVEPRHPVRHEEAPRRRPGVAVEL